MDTTSAGDSSKGDHMFSILLTPDSIHGLIYIPEKHAEQFPTVPGAGRFYFQPSPSSSSSASVRFSCIDPTGKSWPFKAWCFVGRKFYLTGGWDEFLRKNNLGIGDTVSFWWSLKDEKDGEDQDIFYIDYQKSRRSSLDPGTDSGQNPTQDPDFHQVRHECRSSKSEKLLCLMEDSKVGVVGDAHQVVGEIPQRSGVDYSSETVPDMGKQENLQVTVIEREHLFDKMVTPSDVGKLNRLIIPQQMAEKHFPVASSIKEKGLLLNFEDGSGNGNFWRFRYSYWKNSQSYILSKGWKRFVKEKWLAAGDIVSFYRGVGEEGKDKLFIDCTHRPTGDASLSRHQAASAFHRFGYDVALLYCSLFPPDYEFERDMLVQLWMANDIFMEPIERSASVFFEESKSKGYFEFSRNDLVTGKEMYKFKCHGLLDAALRGRGSQVVRIEGNLNLDDFSPQVCHVSLMCHKKIDSTTLGGFKIFKQLKTLMFLRGRESSFKQVPRDFFLSLKLLRALDLSCAHISELPSSIGNMECLRYLDISKTSISRLPEAIDRLNNLQTLRLRGCSNLSTLPKGMRKLVNLRHLDLDVLRQLRLMPQGMGCLTNLRTLSGFLVGRDDKCGIGQLKDMNNLTGSFCISRLENVLIEVEASEACLYHKSHITKLELHWNASLDGDKVGDGKVLSSLQPHTNLEELRILCYGGLELPSWICDPAFSNLVSITLFKFENCLALPCLGQLPSLKFLSVVGFHELKVIDHNFYGGVGILGHIAFPKLEKLSIENMASLEEWTEIGVLDFPHLLKLTLKCCPKLYSLFSLSRLRSLETVEISQCTMLASCLDGKLPALVDTFIIEDCPLISARLLNDGGQDWHKVAHVPNVWLDHREMSFGQRSLQTCLREENEFVLHCH